MLISHPVILEGKKVKLTPLQETHFEPLVAIGQAKEIWAHMAIEGSRKDASLLTALKSAVLKRMSGEEYPFTILDRQTGNIIGSTRFINIFKEHRKLEIGWTWYEPVYWGSGHNTECKYLMLQYCFEVLGAVRVQFMTREENARSRAAIQKIGGKQEGILRKDRIRFDGVRNSVVFSIIDDEWPEVKKKLERLVA